MYLLCTVWYGAIPYHTEAGLFYYTSKSQVLKQLFSVTDAIIHSSKVYLRNLFVLEGCANRPWQTLQ